MTTVTQTLYAIHATIYGRQIPTFYLDAQVQGITDRIHAEQVARTILEASRFSSQPNDGLSISAMAIHYEIQPWSE